MAAIAANYLWTMTNQPTDQHAKRKQPVLARVPADWQAMTPAEKKKFARGFIQKMKGNQKATS